MHALLGEWDRGTEGDFEVGTKTVLLALHHADHEQVVQNTMSKKKKTV